MAKPRSSLTDNLAAGLNNRECEDCYSSHEHMTVKDGLLTFICANGNKIYEKNLDKDLFKKLKNTYQCWDGDIKKFCLKLQKGVHEYMNGSESFREILLPIKKEFYSNLSMKSITDTDYKHIKRVWEDFRFQNLGQQIQIQIDTLLLTDIFESFRNKCLKFFKLEPAYFVSASGLA